MIRLTAIVSGNVQRVGYRARVIDIANAFGLKGMIENQKDGLVKMALAVEASAHLSTEELTLLVFKDGVQSVSWEEG